MIERIVIEVNGDPSKLKSTIDELEKLGTVDKKNRESFEKTAQVHKKALHETGGEIERVENRMKFLAEKIAATFAVERIAEFGVEAIKIFAEAEEGLRKLNFAVTKINGESSMAVEKLNEQSEKLSHTLRTLYTPAQITAAQAQLANFGLSSKQIEKLLPQILDLSSATGMTLTEATEKSILAINGQTKGLRQVGITFKDTGDKTKNLAKLTEDLTKFQGASADAAESDAGKIQRLSNTWEEFKEGTGEFLSTYANSLLDFFSTWNSDMTITELRLKNIQKVFDATYGVVNENIISHLSGTVEEQKKQIEELSKAWDRNATARTKDYEAGKINAEQYVASVEAIKKAKKELLEYGETLGKTQELGKTTENQAKPFKDLSDQIAAAEQSIITGHQVFTKLLLKRQYDADVALANLTITDEAERYNKLNELRVEFVDSVAAIDKKALEDKVALDIEKVRREYASESQKAELINQINLKLIQDEQELDRKAANQKVDDQKAGFDLLMKELEDEQDRIIKQQEDTQRKVAKLQADQNRENLETNILNAETKLKNAKTDAEKEAAQIELRDAKINKIYHDEYKELNELEAEHLSNSLMTQQEYEDAKANIIARANKNIADLNIEAVDKEKQVLANLFEFLEKIADAFEQTIQQNIASINALEARQESRVQTQRVLAEQGLQNTLAFEERQADELEKRRLEEERKAKKAMELKVFLTSLAKFSEDNPNTALAKALGLLAATKVAEVAFGEEGGVIGSPSMKRYRWDSGNIPRHKSGRDVLLHAEVGEQLLTVDQTRKFQQLGGLGLLKKPLHETMISGVVHNNADVVEKLEELVKIQKSEPRQILTIDKQGALVEALIMAGRTERTTHHDIKPRWG